MLNRSVFRTEYKNDTGEFVVLYKNKLYQICKRVLSHWNSELSFAYLIVCILLFKF